MARRSVGVKAAAALLPRAAGALALADRSLLARGRAVELPGERGGDGRAAHGAGARRALPPSRRRAEVFPLLVGKRRLFHGSIVAYLEAP